MPVLVTGSTQWTDADADANRRELAQETGVEVRTCDGIESMGAGNSEIR